MLKYLQEQYIPQLGIEGLKKVSSNKFNCRCPICGDSKTNKRKKRGWFLYNSKFDTWVYNCFNCETTTNFQNICQKLSPALYQSYSEREKYESFNSFISSSTNKEKDYEEYEDSEDDCVSIDSLPDDTIDCIDSPECMEYCTKRKIPLMFIKKWKYSKEYGLIVPFVYEHNLIYGWQSRSLKEKRFHISLPENNEKIWNWYTVDKTKPLYILESVIDATMLYKINRQSIAIIGADINKEVVQEIKYPIFIFDNDETGKLKTIKYSKLFPQAKFLIWDKKIKQKDLNEILVSGVSESQFQNFIDSSIKSGFEANIILQLK